MDGVSGNTFLSNVFSSKCSKIQYKLHSFLIIIIVQTKKTNWDTHLRKIPLVMLSPLAVVRSTITLLKKYFNLIRFA